MLENKDRYLSQYANKLESLSSQINHFTENSESKFLEIGGQLNKYFNTSKAITIKSSSIASSISDKILKNGIDELDWLLKEFNNYLAASIQEIQKDKNELRKIQPLIEDILVELEGFKRIVKHLKMLGISTKIESARLGTEDQGFNALADNVDKLAALISNKVENIHNRANLLYNELSYTTHNLEILEKEQQDHSGVILNNIYLSLNAFNNKHNQLVDKTDAISRASESITTSINEIVSSIQFHDITRQQMQHVCHAFDDNSLRLQNLYRENTIDYQTELGVVYDVCNLQSIQLRNSLIEFSDAVLKIIDSIKTVEDAVSKIHTSIRQLIIDDKGNGKSDIRQVLEKTEVIQSGLRTNLEISKSLAQSINSVINVVDDLSNYVLEIEDIGSEIEVIALNARVKAARTGSNGSALGVLSERIQKLSIDAKGQTISTSEILNKISSESKNLRTSVEKGTYQEENNKLLEATKKICSIVETIISKEENAAHLINNLERDVNGFQSELEYMISSIKVHDEADIAIGTVINEINDLIQAIVGHDIISNKKVNTKKLFDRYTMHSERKLHKGFSDFSDDKRNGNFKNNNLNSNPFGDNVELF